MKLKKVLDTVKELRANQGGVGASTENMQSVKRQIQILENRIDVTLVKLNKTLSTNKDLRQHVKKCRETAAYSDDEHLSVLPQGEMMLLAIQLALAVAHVHSCGMLSVEACGILYRML